MKKLINKKPYKNLKFDQTYNNLYNKKCKINKSKLNLN